LTGEREQVSGFGDFDYQLRGAHGAGLCVLSRGNTDCGALQADEQAVVRLVVVERMDDKSMPLVELSNDARGTNAVALGQEYF
jgi:hypothetical protein